MGFCFAVSFYFSCNNKVSICNSVNYRYRVVVATAKVQIFKQITTPGLLDPLRDGLLLAQKYTNNSINPNLRIHILSKRMVAVPMY